MQNLHPLNPYDALVMGLTWALTISWEPSKDPEITDRQRFIKGFLDAARADERLTFEDRERAMAEARIAVENQIKEQEDA